jgi:hypothetical protein
MLTMATTFAAMMPTTSAMILPPWPAIAVATAAIALRIALVTTTQVAMSVVFCTSGSPTTAYTMTCSPLSFVANCSVCLVTMRVTPALRELQSQAKSISHPQSFVRNGWLEATVGQVVGSSQRKTELYLV